jgi:hypothetical protein
MWMDLTLTGPAGGWEQRECPLCPASHLSLSLQGLVCLDNPTVQVQTAAQTLALLRWHSCHVDGTQPGASLTCWSSGNPQGCGGAQGQLHRLDPVLSWVAQQGGPCCGKTQRWFLEAVWQHGLKMLHDLQPQPSCLVSKNWNNGLFG